MGGGVVVKRRLMKLGFSFPNTERSDRSWYETQFPLYCKAHLLLISSFCVLCLCLRLFLFSGERESVTNRQADRQTDRQTDRDTETDTRTDKDKDGERWGETDGEERETETQTDRQTDTDTARERKMGGGGWRDSRVFVCVCLLVCVRVWVGAGRRGVSVFVSDLI